MQGEAKLSPRLLMGAPMHARQLIESAGVLAAHAGPLLRVGTPVGPDALAEYWIASRCRVDQWGRALRRLGHSHSAPPADDAAGLLERLVEEITLSDSLTRVVGAIGRVADATSGVEDCTPIVDSTLGSHREALVRLRQLTTAWWAPDSVRTLWANQLTDRVAHWTDHLLGHIGAAPEIKALAHDARRHQVAASDARRRPAKSERVVALLLSTSLRQSFVKSVGMPLCTELNQRIAASSLGLLGSEAFDGFGIVRSAWMLRAERTADDAAALIDSLFCYLDPTAGTPTSDRWRL